MSNVRRHIRTAVKTPSNPTRKLAIPDHGRKLGLGGVSLTKAKANKHDIAALRIVRERLEEILIRSGYLDSAPFSWVTIVIRYGLLDSEIPVYQRINAKYGDLPLAIEVDTHRLLRASVDDLTQIFMVAAMKALVHAGRRYGLPIDSLASEMGILPLPSPVGEKSQ
jgi:Immunity protein 39